nr:immunoglobulin light chain junction region [Macaca mulatta]MOX08054.1 immunoglobulin light chain junction region [Macaca mulatta]MOX08995.1 immunoglobulin light chain junction region [Macaca mulatta]MOX10133.1 immunoglobulin light chain junction region [Macaca mulatta]MOX10319.1 immunoglobulin light chain junction region [Macaca mulatta]
CLQTKNSPRTF